MCNLGFWTCQHYRKLEASDSRLPGSYNHQLFEFANTIVRAGRKGADCVVIYVIFASSASRSANTAGDVGRRIADCVVVSAISFRACQHYRRCGAASIITGDRRDFNVYILVYISNNISFAG